MALVTHIREGNRLTSCVLNMAWRNPALWAYGFWILAQSVLFMALWYWVARSFLGRTDIAWYVIMSPTYHVNFTLSIEVIKYTIFMVLFVVNTLVTGALYQRVDAFLKNTPISFVQSFHMSMPVFWRVALLGLLSGWWSTMAFLRSIWVLRILFGVIWCVIILAWSFVLPGLIQGAHFWRCANRSARIFQRYLVTYLWSLLLILGIYSLVIAIIFLLTLSIIKLVGLVLALSPYVAVGIFLSISGVIAIMMFVLALTAYHILIQMIYDRAKSL